MERAFPPRGNKQVGATQATASESSSSTGQVDEVRKDVAESSDDSNAGAVVMLFPPRSQIGFSLYRIYLACKLWLLDLLDKVYDRWTDESVSLVPSV